MNGNLAMVVERFQLPGVFVEALPYGDGHINDTYKVWMEVEGKKVPYLLQRINTRIFTDPAGLMNNIAKVTDHIRKKILTAGGNPDREVLQLIPTTSGEVFYKSPDGNCYRCYVFIQDAKTYNLVEDPKHMYYAGKAFGAFQKYLSDFPAHELAETIPNFHHTQKRYEAFCRALATDACKRADTARKEIDSVTAREGLANSLISLLESGLVPLKVTHNDTKFNNVMLDDLTGEGICVVDLDTVMSGLALYDFGDAIRSGGNTAKEDEADLDLVALDLIMFEQYVMGFIEAAGPSLNEVEIDYLALSPLVMTLECGMRFLTDYLEGDHYFKTAYETHNLVRARNQLALVADMEVKLDRMKAIVDKCRVLYG